MRVKQIQNESRTIKGRVYAILKVIVIRKLNRTCVHDN